MGAIYNRQSSFADGDTITAALFNNELDQLEAAFVASTGHTHDGTTGEGGPITVLGPAQDISVGSTQILPATDDAVSLGSATKEFKDAYFDGTVNLDALVIGTSTAITSVDTDLSSVSASDDTLASAKAIKTYIDAQVTAQDLDLTTDSGTIDIDLDSETLTISGTTNEISTSASGTTVTIGLPDDVTIGSDLTVTDNLTVNGNTVLGNAATDTVTITADVKSNIIPETDSTYNLGDSSNYWANAYIDAITTTGNISVGGNLTVTGNTTISGNLTFGDAATDTVTVTADIKSNLIPQADNTYDLGAPSAEWKDLYVNGTAYVDAINFNGSAITATATEINLLDGVTATTSELNILDGVTATATELNVLDGITSSTSELNILDGVTSTATELNLVDGSAAGTVVNNKAVIYSAAGAVNATTLQIGGTSISATATELNVLDGITATTSELNILDGVTSTASELNLVDGSSAGTVVNNKAVIYSAAGAVNATTLQIGGTSISATATELNVLDGITATTSELNILDGVTATATELNVLDGITATTSELNKIDGFSGTYEDLNYAKDLRATGVTSTEYDYLDGVSSNIQTQINASNANALAFAIALG